MINSSYYNAFLDTQSLNLNAFFKPYHLNQDLEYKTPLVKEARLGHVAEKLFFNLLKQEKENKAICTNLQVIKDKITLGELDALIYDDTTLEHIEFCYKFYLHDINPNQSKFMNWIGPNRRDALHLKVDKLKNKQLPLLYSDEAKAELNKLIPNFEQLEIQQYVSFKAQLFVHLNDWNNAIEYEVGTPDGFYIYFDELNRLKGSFYIPSKKHEWLLSPDSNVNWVSKEKFIMAINKYYEKDSNPLCWYKTEKDELNKIFVVNWSN